MPAPMRPALPSGALHGRCHAQAKSGRARAGLQRSEGARPHSGVGVSGGRVVRITLCRALPYRRAPSGAAARSAWPARPGCRRRPGRTGSGSAARRLGRPPPPAARSASAATRSARRRRRRVGCPGRDCTGNMGERDERHPGAQPDCDLCHDLSAGPFYQATAAGSAADTRSYLAHPAGVTHLMLAGTEGQHALVLSSA